jgi:hypothetical protein
MKRQTLILFMISTGLTVCLLTGGHFNKKVQAQQTGSKVATLEPTRVGLPRFGVDLRVELMAIIFRLAGSPEYNQGTLQPYITDIDRHFGPYRDHPAVQIARELRTKMGVGNDVVMYITIHMNDPYELRERVAFDAPGGILDQKGIPKAQAAQFAAELRRFLEAVRRFVDESRARQFFSAHQPLYDMAGLRLRQVIEEHADLRWFDRFYGAPPAADFIVVVHEFSHSFVNHLVEENVDRFAQSGPRVFAPIADAMSDQSYGDWRIMLFESLVRAASARYILEHQGEKEARREVADHHGKGYIYMADLFALLGEYEANRKEYPTLRSFMPRVIVYFEQLAGRVDEMKSRYDAMRPKVASISIENGSENVDPALTEIMVRFDQPMQKTSPILLHDVRPVRGGRDRFPEIVSQAFESNGTTYRMGIRLKPDQAYEFVLNRPSGGDFVSADGVPLAPYHIKFKTRSASK